MRYKIIILFISAALLLNVFSVSAQAVVPFDVQLWQNHGKPKAADYELFDSRETLKLYGKVFMKGVSLKSGTIEVDVYANTKRSFAGIFFRKKDNSMEDVYMRMHKSAQVDAVQYTPIHNGESNWQLYNEYQANVVFKQAGWNTLKVVFAETVSDVYVNGVKVVTIDKLRTDNAEGAFGLFSFGENRFSNFRYSTKAEINTPVQNVDTKLPEQRIITNWYITDAQTFKGVASIPADFENLKYKPVETEPSGLLPISKHLKKNSFGNFEDNEEAYTVAMHMITNNTAAVKRFSFDYSDKIWIYLNGQLVFSGNNAFHSKGLQFQGHLDINGNTLFLHLNKGKNIIHCVVVDRENGWGLIGKLE